MTRGGLLLTVATAGALLAQPAEEGRLGIVVPRPPLRAYEALDDLGRASVSRSVYEAARDQHAFEIADIRYASRGDGGGAVPGVLIRPRTPGAQKWPAIIYNRGGTGDSGHIDDLTVVEMYLLAKEGFVVVASDYRFHGVLSRRDDWGGLDVDDVLSLVPLLRAQPTVDSSRVFMVGVSRGGTTSYLALKRGIAVKAAAVIAGPSDLEALGKYRPELVKGDNTYDGWAQVWPDYAHRSAEHYRERSLVYWADRVKVPVLIMHAKDDRVVPVAHALRAAAAFQQAGVRYDVELYLNDDHSLSRHRDDRNRKIVAWFRLGSVNEHTQGVTR
ncbi:MAG TPA: prolyl oligopeptidase family serine peptidase [Vicinamibacterales bacterium]|nr:prolyl oligopeptidase family serine peptidase [Vicinamibacterales bacterium]